MKRRDSSPIGLAYEPLFETLPRHTYTVERWL